MGITLGETRLRSDPCSTPILEESIKKTGKKKRKRKKTKGCGESYHEKLSKEAIITVSVGTSMTIGRINTTELWPAKESRNLIRAVSGWWSVKDLELPQF